MVKIKTIKKLNLPQLIEYAWDNDVRCRTFIANDKHIPGKVNFDENGMVDIQTTVGNDETFTVEVEEEITEDTHLDFLYVLTDAKDVYRCNNFTIKSTSLVVGQDDLTFFTLIDNDLVKICDKGKLVE